MSKLVYTYALVKSLCDQGEDYLDTFWPFAIKSFAGDQPLDSGSIQRNLKERFDLEVPIHVLETMLNRAKKRGYIKKKERRYQLSTRGLEYSDALETDKEVERRINALVEDMTGFFKDHETPLTPDEIANLLLSVVHANIEPLIQFVNPSVIPSVLYIPKPEGHEDLLVEYFNTAEERKPQNYATLRDMVLGSVISVMLYAREASDIVQIGTEKFKRCQIFLDTNFVLSVLGLDTPEFNEPARELFRLLKNRGFDLRVFGFTVDEICRVVGGYLTQAHRYPATIGVDTLYSSLKRQGWTRTRVREFIANIESILQEREIGIRWIPDIELDNYTPPDQALRSIMTRYKPDQGLFYQNHDLAAIAITRKLRKRPVRRIEDSKAFFLSSDGRLSRFNFIEMGHKENGTITEVIQDRLLTSILWLKDPSAELSLKSIIAAYSRDLFIKRRVWDSFYEVLRQLRQEGKVEDDNISMLFYHGYIEDVLRPFDVQQIDQITPDFVLEEIEKAAKLREQAEETRIREKEQEFLRQLKEAVSAKEEEKAREWLERIQKVKSSLRESAERKARKDSFVYASLLTFLATLVALPVIYAICLISKRAGIYDFVAIALPSLVGSGGLAALWVKIRTGLEIRLVNRLYSQKLREAALDKVTTD